MTEYVIYKRILGRNEKVFSSEKIEIV